MPVANPLYNPNWQQVHDFHNEKRSGVEAAIKKHYADGARDPSELLALKEEFGLHHQACLDSFKTQHKTIQEYAQWVFGNFSVTMGTHSNVPTLIPDFESFKTLDEVSQAWSLHQKAAEESDKIKRHSLKTGKPGGLNAFSSPETMQSAWQTFIVPGAFDEMNLLTLVTLDTRDDSYHICMMQDTRENAVPLFNYVEDIATYLYTRLKIMVKEQSQSQLSSKDPAATFTNAAIPLRDIEPDQVHFYTHVPPEKSMSREMFSRIRMNFDGKHYSRPSWENFDVIPAYLQRIRFDIAKTVESAPPDLQIK